MSTQWVSVEEAMTVAKRSKTQIYLWVQKQHVRSRKNAKGVTEVFGPDILAAEARMVRGRPRGTARPPGWPTSR